MIECQKCTDPATRVFKLHIPMHGDTIEEWAENVEYAHNVNQYLCDYHSAKPVNDGSTEFIARFGHIKQTVMGHETFSGYNYAFTINGTHVYYFYLNRTYAVKAPK